MSDPADGLPAVLELAWERAIQPTRIELVFDTGMYRPLTLSPSDAFMERVIWGQGQPETVRDYRIEGHMSGAWHSLLDVTANYQRRRIHKLETDEPVDKVRVVVEATHGLDHARICEVRVYEADAPVWCRIL